MKSFICWISPKSKENWDICKQNNMWGIGKNSNVANDHCKKISKGDRLYIWVGDLGYVASAEVTVDRPIYVDNVNITAPWRGDYSYLIPWKITKELNKPVYLKFNLPGQVQEITNVKQGVTISGFFEINEDQSKALENIFEQNFKKY